MIELEVHEWSWIRCLKCKQPIKLEDQTYLYRTYDFAHVECSLDTVVEGNHMLVENDSLESILNKYPELVARRFL